MASERLPGQGESSERTALLASVKFGLGRLFVAVKNFALYPDTNQIKEQSLAGLMEWFDAFLEEHGKLRLGVELGRIVLGRTPVYEDKPGEQSLIFPLFRDGVQWLEFEQGLTADEMRTFLILLTRHRSLKEDADDDLVTTLWEADFTCIKFSSADTFWNSEPLADLSTLRVTGDDWPEMQDSVGYGYHGRDYGAGGGAGFHLGAAPGHGEVSGGNPDEASAAQPGFIRPAGRGVSGDLPGLSADSADPNLNFGVTGGQLKAKPIAALLVEAAAEDETEGVENLAGDDGQVFEIAGGAPGSEEACAGPPGSESPGGGEAEGEGEGWGGEGEGEGEGWGGEGEGSGGGGGQRGLPRRGPRRGRPDPKKHVRKQLDFWTITPEEEEQIKAMVAHEEQREKLGDGLDLCLVMAKEALAADVDPVGDFLAETARVALSQGKFNALRVFLEELTGLAAEAPERAQFVETLKHKLAASDCLTGLADLEPAAVQGLDQSAWHDLQALILLMPPQTAGRLIQFLGEVKDQTVFKFLLPLAAILILKLAPPDTSFTALPPIVLAKLLKVIEALAGKSWGPFPLDFFIGFTRHLSSRVRAVAARAILNSNPDHIRHVLHLLNDPETAVNGLLCAHLEKHPSRLGERALLDYLQENHAWAVEGQGDLPEDRLFNCYLALGRCASPASLPFLTDALLQKSWKTFIGLGDNSHRQGAALALMLMRPQAAGAAEALRKAAKSPFRLLRQSVWKAEERAAHQSRPVPHE